MTNKLFETNPNALFSRTRVRAAIMAALLLSASTGLTSAESGKKYDFEFTNVTDSTQGLTDFQTFPAINNKSDVVLTAFRSGYGQGVFRSRHGEMTTIATETDGLHNFGNDATINAAGVVAFHAITNSGSLAIFTGDGLSKRLIADSAMNGLAKIGMGSPSINASGTVAFESLRIGPGSVFSVFTGNGGPLTTVLSTSKTGFSSFGNVAINDAGKIVFSARLSDGSRGVFTSAGTLVNIVDTNTHPEFDSFGDPVIK
jgi:hypothetical protein